MTRKKVNDGVSGVLSYIRILSKARVAQKAIAQLWFGTAATAAAALITQILLARSLGPNAFGNLFSALALVNLITPLIAFGVPAFWLKVFGEEGAGANRWLKPSYEFTIATGGLCVTVVAIWANSETSGKEAKNLLLILIPLLASQPISAMVASVLQIEGRFNSLATWDSITNIARLIFVACYVSIAGKAISELAVAFGYLVIAFVIITIGVVKLAHFFKEKCLDLGVVELPKSNPSMKDVAGESWRFGLNSLLYIVYYQIDIIMIEKMFNPAEAGVYSAAYLMIGATYTVPGVIFQKYLMPKLHYWHFNDRSKIVEIAIKGTLGMALLGVLAAIAVAAAAAYLVPIVFGNEYSKAIPLIYVLCLAIPLKFSSTCLNVALTSGKWLQTKIKILGAATFANVLINILIIPRHGGEGAAWVTVGTEALVLVLSIVATRTYAIDTQKTAFKGN